jgi:hypothetical protein
MIEILEHSTIEILSTVDRDLLRNSVTTDDILLEKILDGVGGYNCYWFHFNPFGEVLNCDNDEGVVLSYPVPRNRERSLHTCAQDVQITRMATIW